MLSPLPLPVRDGRNGHAPTQFRLAVPNKADLVFILHREDWQSAHVRADLSLSTGCILVRFDFEGAIPLNKIARTNDHEISTAIPGGANKLVRWVEVPTAIVFYSYR